MYIQIRTYIGVNIRTYTEYTYVCMYVCGMYVQYVDDTTLHITCIYRTVDGVCVYSSQLNDTC